jgi:16S rRNA processing protein RimM
VSSPEFAIVGRIRKPHGIRGEVVVEPVTSAPEAIFASGARVFVGGTSPEPPAPAALREVRIERARGQVDAWLVKLDAVADRNEAERWRDRYVFLPEDELPAPAPDEVYLHEFEGMTVVVASASADGGEPTVVGEVVAWYELPQGLVLEIKKLDGALAMVPYNATVVREVDLDARRIVLTPPDGLLD